jgi:zinc/manganese transport system permease protein
VFFLTVFTTRAATGNSNANVTVLFGSLFGISPADAATSTVIAAALIVVVLAIGRPLLFVSLDPAVAAARGLPVRLLGIVFLGVVGATAAEASRAVGALLLLGLLAAPAAAAQRLTNRPWAGLALSAGLAVAAIWIGITASFLVAVLPPSFTIMAAAAAEYAIAALLTRGRTRARPADAPLHHHGAHRPPPPATPAPRATVD